MKNILIIIPMIFMIFCSDNNLVLYNKAYNYILKSNIMNEYYCEYIQNNKYNIEICDSLVSMPITNFFSEYIKGVESNKDKEKILDSLSELESKLYYKPEYCPILKKLNNNTESKFVLFFSKPYKNILFAEVLYNYNSEKSYKKITMLNNGLMFMFKFDDNNRIISETHIFVQYD